MRESMAEDGTSVRFGGIERLYGADAARTLARSHVCVIGLGGVGSWVVEALARSGIGALTLVDLDEVCASNINRQLHALTGTIGRAKAEVLAERVRAINPEAAVTVVQDFFTADTADAILGPGYDIVVDCIDKFSNKLIMIKACRRRRQRLIVVGGAGGRRDPTRVKVTDITKAQGDKMLAMLRKKLRQKHDFPRKGTWSIRCVYSDEVPVVPEGMECSPDGLDCATGYGAVTFVTGTFGFLASAAAVEHILRGEPA
jgi:tRNA A37 threonylcarbamoyladenosine dehydratase